MSDPKQSTETYSLHQSLRASITEITEFPGQLSEHTSEGCQKLIDKLAFSNKANLESLDPEMGDWVGFFLKQVDCISEDQVLLAVAYHNPRPASALYTYDIDSAVFRKLAIVEPDIQQSDKYYELKRLDATSAIALFYSGRTRKAAELYYNEHTHFIYFGSKHPNGIEFLKVSVELGKIVDWAAQDQKLFFQTRNSLDKNNITESNFSLDISGL